MSISDPCGLILGKSPEIVAVRNLIMKIAPRREPVLICGPTGAGKELVAEALHLASGRAGRFVPFNVCAIPETMFEDALFGHIRGAFTGATSEAQGYLVEAHAGTAFFDEVSGLTPQMQVKILRAIETGVFRPVGARMDRRSDFRVVAALNEPLDDLLENGRFRHDLAHRLATFVIHVPPLVERPSDIAVLARVFAERASPAHFPQVELMPSAIRALEQYEWPGNVRELRNVIHATVALADSPSITGPMLIETMARRGAKIETAGKLAFQRRQLLELLNDCDWNTVEVADRLGVDRATVYRRMTSAGIPTLSRNPGRRNGEPGSHGSSIAI